MKRIIVITSLIATFTSFSAFGQAYFSFSGAKSTVWDGFTVPGLSQPATNVNVAFLWGPNGDIPQVDAIMASVPTNMTSTSLIPFTTSFAWTEILNDPNFTLAVNAASGQVVVATVSSRGGFIYNSGAGINVTGTSLGNTYTLFEIGWDANYSTPQLAAANNAAMGWGAPFSYTPYAITATTTSMTGSPFGVVGVPEPATMALVGLGGLSLLLFRCRK